MIHRKRYSSDTIVITYENCKCEFRYIKTFLTPRRRKLYTVCSVMRSNREYELFLLILNQKYKLKTKSRLQVQPQISVVLQRNF